MSLDEQVVTKQTPSDVLRKIAKTNWECPHCHRHMTLNSKGNHLKHCQLNPDRPVAYKRGSKRSDLVECQYCRKGISPLAMAKHVDNSCRVAQAIREGRLVDATLMKVGLAPEVPVFDPPVTVGDGGQISWVITAPTESTNLVARIESVDPTAKLQEQLDLVKTILEMAVEEILADQFDGEMTFSMARRIDAGLMQFVDVLIKELLR
jgi:hypothetical protein